VQQGLDGFAMAAEILVGSAVLGQVFDRLGWTACVIGIGASLVAGGLLAIRFDLVLQVLEFQFCVTSQ